MTWGEITAVVCLLLGISMQTLASLRRSPKRFEGFFLIGLGLFLIYISDGFLWETETVEGPRAANHDGL